MRYCNNCSAATYPTLNLSNYHYGIVDFVFSVGNVPAPIQNDEITLAESNRGFVVSWKTLHCEPQEHYLVQKSTDNKTWNTIGKVNCKPSTTLQYTDENPTNGANYYRLKVATLGESFTYTNTVRGTWNSNTEVSIFPNPAYNNVTVSYNASQVSKAEVLIYDLLGKTVIAKSYKNTIGVNDININTSELAEGVYTIVVKENNEILQKQTIQKMNK